VLCVGVSWALLRVFPMGSARVGAAAAGEGAGTVTRPADMIVVANRVLTSQVIINGRVKLWDVA